ncbi:MAG: energy-coupling factor ABC transporter substrate-binding protein [Flavonifractor plautii]
MVLPGRRVRRRRRQWRGNSSRSSNPDYEPWFEPILEPASGEVESLLFALQAAIGAGVVGFVLGRITKKPEIRGIRCCMGTDRYAYQSRLQANLPHAEAASGRLPALVLPASASATA